MLPDPDHLPARRLQDFIRGPVSLDIPPQFWGPIPLIAGRLTAVDRANMPKASIDEHGDHATSKHDVGTYAPPLQIQAKVLPEPEAVTMKS